MNELFSNPYLIVAVVTVLGVIIWKLFDQKRDRMQKEWQEIGKAFATFGWDEAGAIFEALARDGYEEAVAGVKSLATKLRGKNGVEEVMVTAIIKALRDPEFRKSTLVKERLDPVLAESALGFLLDDKTQAELALLAPVLGEYGSVEFQHLFSALGAKQLDQAKLHFQAIVTMLRDKDRLDDELVKRAAKALPRIVRADPAHYPTLKAIFDGITPPAAATPQMAKVAS